MHARSARYFMAVAEHGSMRAAAEALRIAQSALSRGIMNVEQELGVTMLERRPRGVVLTQAGEIFLRFARDDLASAQRMREEIGELNGLRRGTIRIHAVESLARSMLPRLIGAYWKSHPGVIFDVNTDTSDHILRAVREAETDIGLSYNSPVAPDIEVRLQMREPLVALVASGHRLTRAKSITMRQASAFPVALTNKRSRSRLLVDEACRKERLSFSPVLETNYVELLTNLVEHSSAVTFLLRLSAADRIDAGAITAIPVRNDAMSAGTIEVLTRARRSLSPAGEDFLLFLRRALHMR